jgi:hypothetical protein
MQAPSFARMREILPTIMVTATPSQAAKRTSPNRYQLLLSRVTLPAAE